MGGSVPGFVMKKASLERGKAVLSIKRHMLKVRSDYCTAPRQSKGEREGEVNVEPQSRAAMEIRGGRALGMASFRSYK